MSKIDEQKDEIAAAMEQLQDDETYADEGFAEIDVEDEEEDSGKKMKKEKRKFRRGRRKKKRLSNKMAIALSLIVSVLAVGYVGIAVYYSGHFFANTKINGIDCSNKSVNEVESYLEKQVADYKLTLKESGDKSEEITGQSISLKYVPGDQIKNLLENQNQFLWPESFFKSQNVEAKMGVEYDESTLKTLVANLECMKEENQVAAVNAHPEYQNDKFVIIPETEGTQIDAEKFRNLVIESVNGLSDELNLSEAGCYQEPQYTSESDKVKEACDTMNKYLGVTVTYDFSTTTEVVNATQLSQWVKVDDDMNVVFDETAVKAYIQSLADKYDTKGKQRTFTSASGNTVTVSGGSYGWKIDQSAEYNALIANIQSGESVTREPNYSSRAASHEGNDVGNTYAEVNLSTQHMYFVKDGQIALETDVVTGNPNKGNSTPAGVYSLAYKAKDQVLRGTKKADGTYEYETPVSYWMPFNGGIGFHDASWQPTFGGSRYLTNGSHGCVNMPPAMAAQLFNLISAGTPVVVHN